MRVTNSLKRIITVHTTYWIHIYIYKYVRRYARESVTSHYSLTSRTHTHTGLIQFNTRPFMSRRRVRVYRFDLSFAFFEINRQHVCFSFSRSKFVRRGGARTRNGTVSIQSNPVQLQQSRWYSGQGRCWPTELPARTTNRSLGKAKRSPRLV